MNTPQSHIPLSEGKADVPLLRRIYLWAQIVSLDVAIGSLGGGIMAARVLEVHMPWAWYVCLPLAVWLIYTLDHLMDAHRLGGEAHTPRHLYHHHNFWPLMAIWLVLAPVCLVLALAFLPVEGVYFGLAMSGMVAGHLLMVKLIGDTTAPWLMKELGVGFIYAAGLWGLPLMLAMPGVNTFHILFFLQFTLLALVNLLEFSIFEYETDKLDGHTSFVRAIGQTAARRMVYIFLGLALIAGIFVMARTGFEYWKIQAVFGGMIACLGAIMLIPGYFSKMERYRTWGDAAFLLPYLFLAI